MIHLGRWSIYGVRISVREIVCDRNKAIDIREWSIFGGGQLERFYCIYSDLFSTCPHFCFISRPTSIMEKSVNASSASNPTHFNRVLSLLRLYGKRWRCNFGTKLGSPSGSVWYRGVWTSEQNASAYLTWEGVNDAGHQHLTPRNKQATENRSVTTTVTSEIIWR